MVPIKISAVSYLNSLPFVYGLSHSPLKKECDISLDIPSVCADKLITGKVDIGLIPVAAIPRVPNANIISNYCIGAVGAVKTVCLFSEVPLKEIKTVFLDYQSRTSVMLAQVLANEYWKIKPQWINGTPGFEKNIKGTSAAVVIGDRTFSLISSHEEDVKKGRYYIYDLALEWQTFSGLPFVFACWVANKEFSNEFIRNFDRALQAGLTNIDKTLEEFNSPDVSRDEAKEYLTTNISYNFDEAKKKALNLFLELSQKIIHTQ